MHKKTLNYPDEPRFEQMKAALKSSLATANGRKAMVAVLSARRFRAVQCCLERYRTAEPRSELL